MLIPELRDELVVAAASPSPLRRASARAAAALCAALLTLLIAVPTTQAMLPAGPATLARVVSS